MSDIEQLKRLVSKEIAAASANQFSVGDYPISETETMQFQHRSVYDAQGKSAAHIVSHASALAGVQLNSILDFPCGHGRVMRAFRANWPDAKIVACDIDKRGVDFCVSTFGAEALYSDRDLDVVEPNEPVDVVWIGSLLTHLDADGWPSVFDFAERSLRDGGILVATYAGAYVAELVRSGDHQFVATDEADKAVASFDDTGFGFMLYEHADYKYGRTLTSHKWASDFLIGRKSLRPLLHFERGWAGRQTVLAAIKDVSFAAIR